MKYLGNGELYREMPTCETPQVSKLDSQGLLLRQNFRSRFDKIFYVSSALLPELSIRRGYQAAIYVMLNLFQHLAKRLYSLGFKN
jgi:hypothetical protein